MAHYLKREYPNLNNFCFEITDNHLHRYGKTSADLAANFKLTNQKVVQASKTRQTAEEYDDFFGYLKFAFRGRRMATFDPTLSLYWGRTKPWKPNLLNQKRF